MRPVSVHTESEATVRVVLRGELDVAHAEEIQREVRSAIEQVLPRKVQMDLSEVTFIDTSGLGTVVNLVNVSREVGAECQLVAVSEGVRARLRIAGLLGPLGATGGPA
jgi:anti-anti-sigma factor